MGLGSFIKKAVGAVTDTLGFNPISTAIDLAGGFMSDDRAATAADTSYARQMQASNTSYQRAVADMRAAGLNPILAYSQGGASTPTAAVAKTTDYSTTGTRGVSNALSLSQVANTQQSTRTAQATENLTRENAETARLNNQGLRAVPPEMRAIAQMGSATGAGLAGAAHFGKTAAPLLKQGASNLKAWGQYFKRIPYDMYKGFKK